MIDSPVKGLVPFPALRALTSRDASAPISGNRTRIPRAPAATAASKASLTAQGEGKRVPVKVTLKGYTYRTTIAVYAGKSYIGVRREVREAAGVAAGDPLTVGLEYDAEVRAVDLPQALRLLLEADATAAAAFEKLSYTRKKEFMQWV